MGRDREEEHRGTGPPGEPPQEGPVSKEPQRRNCTLGERGLLTFKSALSATRGAGRTPNSPPGLMPASHYLPCLQNHQMPLVLRSPTLPPLKSSAEACVVGTVKVEERLDADPPHPLPIPTSTLPHTPRCPHTQGPGASVP